jgi:hypothetical protein
MESLEFYFFGGYLLFFSWEEENECVKGDLVVMCEKMLFMEENVWKQKIMQGSCV